MDKLDELQGSIQEQIIEYDMYSEECVQVLQRIMYILKSNVLDSNSYMRDQLKDFKQTVKVKQEQVKAQRDTLENVMKTIDELQNG